MNKINYGKGFTSLTINFSNTKPNESVSISGTYIDFKGKIHGSRASTITVQGGDNKGAYSVNSYEAGGFYMTQAQRITLMEVLKGLAYTSDNATISSNNGTLEEMCNAIYRNYCG